MIYDISYKLSPEIQVYKDNPSKKPIFKTTSNHVKNHAHETTITINLHTGTHIDFPLHMIEGGATSDSEDLNPLIGDCKVLDLTHVQEAITVEDLKPFEIKKHDFLLFKTKNSFSETFLFDFTYLTEDAAIYLKDKQIRGVGTDGLGIERAQSEHQTHKILLSNNIIIIEGLRLQDIEPKTYDLICLPLSIKGVEASLARAILIEK